jgi:hypothetical protein
LPTDLRIVFTMPLAITCAGAHARFEPSAEASGLEVRGRPGVLKDVCDYRRR